jgi:hypothetical protein
MEKRELVFGRTISAESSFQVFCLDLRSEWAEVETQAALVGLSKFLLGLNAPSFGAYCAFLLCGSFPPQHTRASFSRQYDTAPSPVIETYDGGYPGDDFIVVLSPHNTETLSLSLSLHYGVVISKAALAWLGPGPLTTLSFAFLCPHSLQTPC